MAAATPALGGVSLAQLDAHVRHADPDRWLATRLIGDPRARAEVLALYAWYAEVAGVAARVTQPMMGEMRFAWWSEALDAIGEGRAPEHPMLRAIAPGLREGRLARAPLDRILAARHRDLESAPFADEAALLAFLDDTTGALMAAAALRLDPAAPPEALRQAGRAWGWRELLAGAARPSADLRRIPADWDREICAYTIAARGSAALSLARRELETLPVTSFPAVAYVRLARAAFARRDPGPLGRRATLLRAALSGRI